MKRVKVSPPFCGFDFLTFHSFPIYFHRKTIAGGFEFPPVFQCLGYSEHEKWKDNRCSIIALLDSGEVVYCSLLFPNCYLNFKICVHSCDDFNKLFWDPIFVKCLKE
jgi:hypothetical protein